MVNDKVVTIGGRTRGRLPVFDSLDIRESKTKPPDAFC